MDPALFGWPGRNGIRPAGPPFIRYLAFDGEGEPRVIELAAPVAAGVAGDDGVRAGELPAGYYVTYLHAGPYTHASEPDLAAAHRTLAAWAERHGFGIEGAGCFESYLTGPHQEPNYSNWRTELAYPLAARRD